VGLFVDTAPLRNSAAFRRYFSGQVISIIGSTITAVAINYQAYKLGGNSTAMVGWVAMATLVPFVLSSIVGGAIADSFDRRRILILTQGLLGICSLGLAVNASFEKPQLWLLFVLAMISNALVGVDWPTRSATVPNLVEKGDLQAALSIMISTFNLATIIGPVVAAFFVKGFLPWLYAADALSYVVSFVAIFGLAAQHPSGDRRTVSMQTIGDGFRYLKSERTIQSTFVADLGAMIFGLPVALFPAMAEEIFKDTKVLGYLYAALAAGGVIGSAVSGWTRQVRRQGLAVIWLIAGWGVAVAVFGATSILWLALLGLFVAGWADSVSAIFRSTMVQVIVPDEYRGRLSSIFVAVVRGGPKMGEGESGLANRLGGLQFAAVSGGLGCIVWIAAVALFYPELRRYNVERATT
jgi:MFS family permease